MKNLIHSIAKYLVLFSSVHDRINFHKMMKSKLTTNTVSFNINALNNEKITCRTRGTDCQVLIDTFYWKYHLPQKGLKENAIILDLGANIGLTACHFAATYSQAKIYAVELDCENYQLALRNIQPWNQRIKLINAAIWNENGFVGYSGESSWAYHVDNSSISKVKSITINSLISTFDIQNIDYLKMDVEGAESVLFESNLEWLKITKCINIEIHSIAYFSKILQILEANNFHCRKNDLHSNAIIGWQL